MVTIAVEDGATHIFNELLRERETTIFFLKIPNWSYDYDCWEGWCNDLFNNRSQINWSYDNDWIGGWVANSCWQQEIFSKNPNMILWLLLMWMMVQRFRESGHLKSPGDTPAPGKTLFLDLKAGKTHIGPKNNSKQLLRPCCYTGGPIIRSNV